MKTSCIQHPSKEQLLIIRQWQLDFCIPLGNSARVGAALLSVFEYWHNVKIAHKSKSAYANRISERHGEIGVQDESLLQFHTLDGLHDSILQIGGKTAIKESRKFLVSTGVISEHKNPNKRYSFDSTIYYLFHPNIAQSFITSRVAEPDTAAVENDQRAIENDQRAIENDRTRTKTTYKTTNLDNKEKEEEKTSSTHTNNLDIISLVEKGDKENVQPLEAKKKPSRKKVAPKKEDPYLTYYSERNHGTVIIPEKINTPEFIAQWERYKRYRYEGKTKKALKFAFSDAESESDRLTEIAGKYTLNQAIEAVKRNINEGWEGYFPRIEKAAKGKGKIIDISENKYKGTTQADFFKEAGL